MRLNFLQQALLRRFALFARRWSASVLRRLEADARDEPANGSNVRRGANKLEEAGARKATHDPPPHWLELASDDAPEHWLEHVRRARARLAEEERALESDDSANDAGDESAYLESGGLTPNLSGAASRAEAEHEPGSSTASASTTWASSADASSDAPAHERRAESANLSGEKHEAFEEQEAFGEREALEERQALPDPSAREGLSAGASSKREQARPTSSRLTQDAWDAKRRESRERASLERSTHDEGRAKHDEGHAQVWKASARVRLSRADAETDAGSLAKRTREVAGRETREPEMRPSRAGRVETEGSESGHEPGYVNTRDAATKTDMDAELSHPSTQPLSARQSARRRAAVEGGDTSFARFLTSESPWRVDSSLEHSRRSETAYDFEQSSRSSARAKVGVERVDAGTVAPSAAALSESLWPELPENPSSSSAADEWGAGLRERERLRRLDAEQKGARWNA